MAAGSPRPTATFLMSGARHSSSTQQGTSSTGMQTQDSNTGLFHPKTLSPKAWSRETEARGSRSDTAEVMQHVGGREVPAPPSSVLTLIPCTGALRRSQARRLQASRRRCLLTPLSISLVPSRSQPKSHLRRAASPFSQAWLNTDTSRPPLGDGDRDRTNADTSPRRPRVPTDGDTRL